MRPRKAAAKSPATTPRVTYSGPNDENASAPKPIDIGSVTMAASRPPATLLRGSTRHAGGTAVKVSWRAFSIIAIRLCPSSGEVKMRDLR